jgi:serine/threonine-protein kinase
VPGLEAGSHFVRATAEGYVATADQAVRVEARAESAHHIAMTPAGAALEVLSDIPGLELSIDDKVIGKLPQNLAKLEPGTHLVRVDGGELYEPLEQTVNVVAGKPVKLGPIKLKIKSARIILTAGDGAKDARITVDGKRVHLPVTLEVEPTPHSVKAKRRGYDSFEQEIDFADGIAQKSLEVSLRREGDTAKPETHIAALRPTTPSAAVVDRAVAEDEPSADAEEPETPAEPAVATTLNINSIPAATVVVDGRPVGRTPKIGLSVAPGPHTVVFIHPEHGRTTARATVKEGESQTVTVRF